MTKQEYKDVYEAVGVAMEVYNTLGRGMAEPIYQEAFAMEMRMRGMEFEREKKLLMYYKNVLMDKKNFGEIGLHAERYLYLPKQDDFVLLTHENYKKYITDLS